MFNKNMRYILKIILVAMLATWVVACEDAVDITQPGRLGPEETFQTVTDLQNGLLGVYGALNLSPDVQFNAVFTDEVSIGFDNGGQGIGNGEYLFVLNPNSAAPNAIWTNYYDVINFATRIIEASNIVTVGAAEQEDFNNIVAQAYAIRAFAHFQLLAYFAEDITNNSSLGVIALDFIPSVDDNFPRNTTGEVFTLIESDLNKAETMFADDFFSPAFASQYFVTALRARMAAYRRNYDLADQYASELLNNSPFALATYEEYIALFEDESNAEVIFELERTVNDPFDRQGATGSGAGAGWVGANFAFVGPGIDGSPYFEMSRSLFNAFNPSSARYVVNVSEDAIIDPNYPNTPAAAFKEADIIPIDKYSGSEGQPLLNDIKVFRLSEMLLIKAEALAAAGNINGPLNSTAALIKRLRDVRFAEETILPVFADQQEAFAAILAERRVELAFEAHRWFDLGRLGERANATIDRDPLDCQQFDACTIPVNDFRFRLPIPIVELNANPEIRNQQNPGF